MTTNEHGDLVAIYEGDPWHVRRLLKKFIDEAVITDEPAEKPKVPRTGAQNRALHLDCRLIAEKLNAAGKDMRLVLKATYVVPWTTESVKEHIFRPIMKALTGKESTTDLQKGGGEIEHIHDVIMRELGEKHGIEWHDFPSDEARQLEQLGGYKTAAGTVDVPAMDESNRANSF